MNVGRENRAAVATSSNNFNAIKCFKLHNGQRKKFIWLRDALSTTISIKARKLINYCNCNYSLSKYDC